MRRVTAASVDAHIRRHVLPSQSTLNSDESNLYRRIGYYFRGGHKPVLHSAYEYYRHDDKAGVNTCESINAIIKRGLRGIYHSVSVKHLPRYLDEFEFSCNRRLVSDGERVRAAVQATVGKRLMYKEPINR